MQLCQWSLLDSTILDPEILRTVIMIMKMFFLAFDDDGDG